MKIDIFTFIFVLCIIFVMQAVAIFIQYLLNKKYGGLRCWAAGTIMAAAAYGLQLLRDVQSAHFYSIILSNILFISGIIFCYIGVMRFFDKHENRKLILSLFMPFFLLMLYFIQVKDDMVVRIVIFSTTMAAFSILTAWSLYQYKIQAVAFTANFVAVIFLFYGVFFIFRVLMTVFGAPLESYFNPSFTQIATFMLSLIASTLWVFGLILMVNQRLNVEMGETQSHFEVMFNTGPDILVVTRLDNGVIIDVNDEFTKETGFLDSEVMGKTTLEIDLWHDTHDHEKMLQQLNNFGVCEKLEVDFRRKDGSLLNTTLDAGLISIRGMPHIYMVLHDITLYKLAEKELQESEKKYRLLVESAQEIIVVIQDNMIRLFNPMACILTGFSESELVSAPFLDFIHPEERPMVIKNYQKRLQGEKAQNYYQFRLLTKKGDYRCVEINAVITEWEGRPATINFLTDITERMQYEKALQESEALYRAFLNASPDGFVIMDMKGEIQFVTPSTLEMLGYQSEEGILGKDGLGLVALEDRERAAMIIDDLIHGIDVTPSEYSVICADGSLLAIEANGELIRDAAGQPYRLIFILRDITARKQATLALRESEARFRLIAENTGDVIWVFDIEEDRYRFISPSVRKLRGYWVDEAMAQPVSESMTAESLAHVRQTMSERLELYKKGIHETYIDEIAQLHKDGSIIWTESVTRILTDDESGKYIILGVSRDITERKLLLKELERQATTDSLTGAFNRRYFLEQANIELKRATRHGHPLSVALFDIDRFKSVNDTYGHSAGDQALKFITMTCRHNIREIDLFARFGGDEFVILFPETNQEMANLVVDRIHQALADQPLQFGEDDITISISSGISYLTNESDSLDDLLARADQMLYEAKKSRQNRMKAGAHFDDVG